VHAPGRVLRRCGAAPRVGEVGAHQATGFLRCQGRDWRLSGWPLWQTVDAVQLLLVDIERAPVSKSVALDYRKEEVRDLSAGASDPGGAAHAGGGVEASPR